jgi:hypothetical protein
MAVLNGTNKALHAALNLPIEQLKPLGVILSTRLAFFLYGASLRFAVARLRALSEPAASAAGRTARWQCQWKRQTISRLFRAPSEMLFRRWSCLGERHGARLAPPFLREALPSCVRWCVSERGGARPWLISRELPGGQTSVNAASPPALPPCPTPPRAVLQQVLHGCCCGS